VSQYTGESEAYRMSACGAMRVKRNDTFVSELKIYVVYEVLFNTLYHYRCISLLLMLFRKEW